MAGLGPPAIARDEGTLPSFYDPASKQEIGVHQSEESNWDLGLVTNMDAAFSLRDSLGQMTQLCGLLPGGQRMSGLVTLGAS